jgi:hypothetical protein
MQRRMINSTPPICGSPGITSAFSFRLWLCHPTSRPSGRSESSSPLGTRRHHELTDCWDVSSSVLTTKSLTARAPSNTELPIVLSGRTRTALGVASTL